jgi:hypothetical protein
MAIAVSLNPSFLTGGKVVLIDSTGSREILEAIEGERVTTTILVVAQLHQGVNRGTSRPGPGGRRRYAGSGSGLRLCQTQIE